MSYSELIKNFERVRDYMRQFFVYGFKSRTEYDKKSARSYDNERRRIESWLGDYMSFKQDSSGKNVFLSVDSRNIHSNPLYQAFKAKSFTTGDITFHFYIMDILYDGRALSIKEIIDEANERYLIKFPDTEILDESSVRKKLKEYVELGLLECEKIGRELRYRKSLDQINLDSWKEALAFYSEADPLGVVGSYLQGKVADNPDYFGFKHHYILHALDSDILCSLLFAIGEKRTATITVLGKRTPDKETVHEVLPFKIYISTQTGRQYLLVFEYRFGRFTFYRIDGIHDVKVGEIETNYDDYKHKYSDFCNHVWGTSIVKRGQIDHLEMTVYASDEEYYIVDRLKRERRNGSVSLIAPNYWRYSVDCYDAAELIPWLRTFIGRIAKLDCTNADVVTTFYDDIKSMSEMYGGEEDAV